MTASRSDGAASLWRRRGNAIEMIDSLWPSVAWVGLPSQNAETRWGIGDVQAFSLKGVGFQVDLAPSGLSSATQSDLILLILSGSVTWSGESAPQIQGRAHDLIVFPRGGEGRVETLRSAHIVALSLPHPEDVHPPSLGPRLISSREGGGVARALGELVTAPPRNVLTDDFVAHATFDAIAALVALIYAGPMLDGSGTSLARTTRFQSIESYLQAHFGDASLSPTSVAQALSISPRYLHRVLKEHGMAFRPMLIRLRVESCRKHLLDPKFDGQTVAEVAYAAGFNDISQFNRHFREAYGVVPSQLRSRVYRVGRSRGIGPGTHVTISLSSLSKPVTT